LPLRRGGRAGGREGGDGKGGDERENKWVYVCIYLYLSILDVGVGFVVIPSL
jgi:hypothetical protein